MREPLVFVRHMREAGADVLEYTRGGRQEFEASKLVQDAVMRKLEIMGEAAKNVPLPFREKWPGIPWRAVAGLRDVLSHAYFQVQLGRVWGIVEEEVPALVAELDRILQTDA